jgi:hypothetical protein
MGIREDVTAELVRYRSFGPGAPPGHRCTVVAVGHLVQTALSVAERLADQVSVEVFDPRTVYPFDWAGLAASLERTGRLVVIDDSNRSCGIGGEILATAAEEMRLVAPPKRITRPDGAAAVRTGPDQPCSWTKDQLTAAVRAVMKMSDPPLGTAGRLASPWVPPAAEGTRGEQHGHPDLDRRALAAATRRSQRVTAAQLGGPTPRRDWALRDLLTHGGANHGSPQRRTGETVPATGLGGQAGRRRPLSRVRRVGAGGQRGVRGVPGALDRQIELPGLGTFSRCGSRSASTSSTT